MIQPTLCPICQKPATDPSKTPFCTDRCRKIDFFRWWDGRYAIATSAEMAFDPELAFEPEDGEMSRNPRDVDYLADDHS